MVLVQALTARALCCILGQDTGFSLRTPVAVEKEKVPGEVGNTSD